MRFPRSRDLQLAGASAAAKRSSGVETCRLQGRIGRCRAAGRVPSYQMTRDADLPGALAEQLVPLVGLEIGAEFEGVVGRGQPCPDLNPDGPVAAPHSATLDDFSLRRERLARQDPEALLDSVPQVHLDLFDPCERRVEFARNQSEYGLVGREVDLERPPERHPADRLRWRLGRGERWLEWP
jgi:hypothetical protein